MTDSPMDVGICIPTLNERAAITGLLGRICEVMKQGRYTICFVDDGSTDGTVDAIKAAAKCNPNIYLLERRSEGRGCQRGLASRRGLEWLLGHTDHPVMVDLDADGSQRPEELSDGLMKLSKTEADVIIASKYIAGAKVIGRPVMRRVTSRAYNLFLRMMLRFDILDYSNSYRFYTRRAAQLTLAFPVRYNGPIHLLEMMAIWLSNGMTILEIPTFYDQRYDGVSKVVTIDFIRGGIGALDVVRRYRAGLYKMPRQ